MRGPQSETVFLGSTKAAVDFTCEATASLIFALNIDDKYGDVILGLDQYIDTRTDSNGLEFSIRGVTIPVNLIYNASTINCQFTADNGTLIDSVDATFLIQGIHNNLL